MVVVEDGILYPHDPLELEASHPYQWRGVMPSQERALESLISGSHDRDIALHDDD